MKAICCVHYGQVAIDPVELIVRIAAIFTELR